MIIDSKSFVTKKGLTEKWQLQSTAAAMKPHTQ